MQPCHPTCATVDKLYDAALDIMVCSRCGRVFRQFKPTRWTEGQPDADTLLAEAVDEMERDLRALRERFRGDEPKPQ